jgi:hypothetical protein
MRFGKKPEKESLRRFGFFGLGKWESLIALGKSNLKTGTQPVFILDFLRLKCLNYFFADSW